MTFKQDGVDHIRIHLKGETELGRKLSEFYIRPFRVPDLGEFNHLIGYSLYLKTGMDISKLRHLPPYECLRLIRKENPVQWDPQYYDRYSRGVIASLESDTTLVNMFMANELPYLLYRETPGDLDGDPRGWIAMIYNEYSRDARTRITTSVSN